MLHEKQLKQKGNESEGVPAQTTNHDDDYVGFDPEISRHRSKLRVLYHAATCPCDGVSDCPSGIVHCCASKRVFAHIISCTVGNDCDVPGCQHSRRVWRHYRKCRRNRERCVNENTDSLTSTNCDICSAVPEIHDALILCNRFRTTSVFSQGATIGTSRDKHNTITSENASVDVNCIEATVRSNTQTRNTRNDYDRLPVWRKRNFFHAQQQQLLFPQHEKENVSSSTDFTILEDEKKYYRRGSHPKSALRTSEFSLNSSVGQQSVLSVDRNEHKFRNSDINTSNGTSLSAATQHQFGVLDNGARELSNKISSDSAVQVQLPAHPRDAKRKSRSVVKPTNRR